MHMSRHPCVHMQTPLCTYAGAPVHICRRPCAHMQAPILVDEAATHRPLLSKLLSKNQTQMTHEHFFEISLPSLQNPSPMSAYLPATPTQPTHLAQHMQHTHHAQLARPMLHASLMAAPSAMRSGTAAPVVASQVMSNNVQCGIYLQCPAMYMRMNS